MNQPNKQRFYIWIINKANNKVLFPKENDILKTFICHSLVDIEDCVENLSSSIQIDLTSLHEIYRCKSKNYSKYFYSVSILNEDDLLEINGYIWITLEELKKLNNQTPPSNELINYLNKKYERIKSL